jgi:hypothetical protein
LWLLVDGEQRAVADRTATVLGWQQEPGATTTHNFFLRTDCAGDEIDGGDECFCIVAAPAAMPGLLLELASGPGQKPG